MDSYLHHIQINVSDSKKSFPFYKDLLGYFEYEIIMENKTTLGMESGATSIWLSQTEEKFKEDSYHRKNTGLNHIALSVAEKQDVDEFNKKFLKPKGIKPLYNSPKEFPEYTEGYYAVYFEDPDRVKIEVMYSPEPDIDVDKDEDEEDMDEEDE